MKDIIKKLGIVLFAAIIPMIGITEEMNAGGSEYSIEVTMPSDESGYEIDKN